MTVVKLLVDAVTYAYGLLALCLVTYFAIRNGEIRRKSSPEEGKTLKQAYHDLWTLESSKAGISHEFLRMSSGLQLHYLKTTTSPQAKDLVILLHGFPDSCHLWDDVLESPLSKSATFVALDIPGCGGSDSVERYGPNEVLNAVSEAIMILRQRYLRTSPSGEPLTKPGKCILIGHDWGGVIAYRIAAEAGSLIDHVVTMNTAYTPHSTAKISSFLTTARSSMTAWLHRPVSTSLLSPARTSLSLIATQLLKSNYIFIFQLPLPLASLAPSISQYLLRITHRLSHRLPSPLSTSLPSSLAAHSLASSNGPSPLECKTGLYGPSVLARALRNGDWDQRIQLYKQGLATQPWSHNNVVSTRTDPLTLPPGQGEERIIHSMTSKQGGVSETARFKVPVTVVFGMQDPALDARLVVDGIEEYFVHARTGERGKVVRIAKAGHWTPLEGVGRAVVGAVLVDLLSGDTEGLRGLEGEGGIDVKVF